MNNVLRFTVIIGIYIVSVFLILVSPTYSQIVDTAWIRIFDSGGENYPFGVVTNSDREIFIPIADVVINYDEDGNFLNDFNTYAKPAAIAIDENDDIYIAGIFNYSYLVVSKYKSDGDTSWVRSNTGQGNGWNNAADIAVDSDGNVYVCGSSLNSASNNDVTLIKYNSDGNEEWIRFIDGPNGGSDAAEALSIDNLNNICVVGSANYIYSINPSDYVTIKYYPNGDTAWARYYNGPADDDDQARDVEVDDLGNVYVTGNSDSLITFPSGDSTWSLQDITTIKYDSDGNQIWTSRYNGPANGDDDKCLIQVDNLYNVVVAGRSGGVGTGKDLVTVKYNPDGSEAWVRRFDGPASAFDEVEDLKLDADGNIYVTGDIETPSENKNMITIRYNPNGDTAWFETYNGPDDQSDEGKFLTIDNNGDVIVTGTSYLSPLSNLVTIKYTQNPSGNCCTGNRGNANNDPLDEANISDITFLVNYLFGSPSGPAPVCPEEANANGHPSEDVNISDITYLVNYLFGIPNGPAPGACP